MQTLIIIIFLNSTLNFPGAPHKQSLHYAVSVLPAIFQCACGHREALPLCCLEKKWFNLICFQLEHRTYTCHEYEVRISSGGMGSCGFSPNPFMHELWTHSNLFSLRFAPFCQSQGSIETREACAGTSTSTKRAVSRHL